MKLLLIIFILSFNVSKAQMFSFEKGQIILKTDTMTLRQAFELIHKVVPWQISDYDRVVILKGQKYWRIQAPINKLLTGRNKAWTKINGKNVKVTI